MDIIHDYSVMQKIFFECLETKKRKLQFAKYLFAKCYLLDFIMFCVIIQLAKKVKFHLFQIVHVKNTF